MSMQQWIVKMTETDEAMTHNASAAFVMPGGFLALGEGDAEKPELFRASLIVAPGYWARAYQIQEVQGQ